MIIYLATREEFLKHVREQRIEEEVRERFVAITGHKVAASEFRAWKNSLQCVGNVLQFEEIPSELGVAIEYRIHNTAKRIDLLLSGCDAAGAPAAVIVELKQWEWDFAKFPQSLLTKLLYQALGGNCLTTFIGALMQGGAEKNEATMQLLELLQRAR